MRTPPLLVASLLMVLSLSPSAHAGLYRTNDPNPWPLPPTHHAFELRLGDLRSAASNDPTAMENAYPKKLREQVSQLEGKKAPLSEEDLINLGAGYILLTRYDKALRVLQDAVQRYPKNFMLLANLANAYQGLGEYSRAISYQREVLKNWPTSYPGWEPDQLYFYWRVEHLHLRLMDLRRRAAAQRLPPDRLDELFPEVNFNLPRDKYRAGEVDPMTRAILPIDALEQVKQLVLWLPLDNQLFWLYGELLNAEGDVVAASKVIQELRGPRRFGGGALLLQHRAILLKAAEQLKKEPKSRIPRPVLFAGPASSNPPESPPAVEPPRNYNLADWRLVVAGFVPGLLVGVLAVFQLRRFFRPRSTASHNG